MRPVLGYILGTAAVLLLPTFSAPAQIRVAKHVTVELLTEETTIQPGRPFRAAVRLAMDSSWHTYWRNAGDAGMPTTVKWRLPEGFTAGELEWPVPHTFGDPPEVSYGYEGEILLTALITPSPRLEFGSTALLEATVGLLACQDVCLTGKGELSLKVPVRASDPTPDRKWADAFRRTREAQPQQGSKLWNPHVSRDSSGFVLTVVQTRPGAPIPAPETVSFYPADEGLIDHSGEAIVSGAPQGLRFRLPNSPFPDPELRRLRGVLYAESGWEDGAVKAIWVDVPITEAP